MVNYNNSWLILLDLPPSLHHLSGTFIFFQKKLLGEASVL